MDSETQGKEVDDRAEREGLAVVDLNQATVEELQTLPGIGPSLARRIVEYREERGGFQSPQELPTVSGIGRAAYERLADRLTAAPPEMVVPPAAEEATPEEVPEKALAPPGAPAAREMVAPPEAEEAVWAVLEEGERAAPTEEAPEAEEAPTPPRAEPAAPPPSPAPAREPARRVGLSWLWSSLAGGLLGMIFTLLVFSGINGSLDLSNSRAVLDVQNQMDNLAAEMNSLQGEIGGLRQRLGTLEGLTARMEKAESAVDALRQETVDLDERADALENELTSISEEFSAMETQTKRVATFFDRLQALLQETFGGGEAGAPTPESPVETPTPTQ